MKLKCKWTCLICCLLLLLTPCAALGEENTTWDALLSQALSSVEELTAPEADLTVQASASVTVAPDTAQVSLGMNVIDEDLSNAQAQANTVVSAIIDALENLGIEKSAITTSIYNISPQRDYATGDGTQITGYYVSNNITVKVDDFALLDSVIDTAVTAGANEVYGVSFDVKARSEYYRQALVNAVAAAQEKAELLAQASGVTLNAVKSVSELSSVESYYAYSNTADSVMSAKGAGAGIQGGELNVTAQVQLVYGCKALGEQLEPIG